MTRDEYYEILVALKIAESKNDKCKILSNVIFSTQDNDDNGLIDELIKLYDRLNCNNNK